MKKSFFEFWQWLLSYVVLRDEAEYTWISHMISLIALISHHDTKCHYLCCCCKFSLYCLEFVFIDTIHVTYLLCFQHCGFLIFLACDFRNKEPVGSGWSCICCYSDSFPRVCNISLLCSVSSWSSNTFIFVISANIYILAGSWESNIYFLVSLFY